MFIIPILALLILGLGILAMMGSGIWGLFLAFQESSTWGLLYLFVPFAALAFTIMKWSNKSVRRSFFLSLGGFGAVILSAIIPMLFVSTPANYVGDSTVIYDETDVAMEEDVTPEAVTEAPILESNAAPVEAAPNNHSSVAQAEAQSPCDFKQCMSVGYAAYEQKDYQTALINFERALRQQPNNQYAVNAVNNTKAILQNE